MAVITKITVQQKNKDRYNIFMDFGKGEEYAFSVDEAVLIKFQLKKGLEIDDFSLMEMQFQDDIRKAYNTAVSYLAKRMRSEKEIKDHLKNKEVGEPIINEVTHKLKEQNYINDHEYAHAYLRTALNTTDKGPELIRQELREKGIDKTYIEDVLQEFTIEQQLEKTNTLMEKFMQKNQKDSSKVAKKKLGSLLVRKGYSFSVIDLSLEGANFENQADKDLEAIRIQGEKIHKKFSHLTGFEYGQKMKQALYRKGFSIDLIDKFLSEFTDREE